MKTVLSLSAVLAAVVIGWTGIAARTAPPAAATSKQTAAALYATHCVKCHGSDGKGNTAKGKELGARDFTSDRWWSRTTVNEAAASIRDGYEDMPSYKRKLTAAQIQSLAVYVKSFKH